MDHRSWGAGHGAHGNLRLRPCIPALARAWSANGAVFQRAHPAGEGGMADVGLPLTSRVLSDGVVGGPGRAGLAGGAR